MRVILDDVASLERPNISNALFLMSASLLAQGLGSAVRPHTDGTSE